MVDGKLVITQPEELEYRCTAFNLEYYPEEQEKIELCKSNDFEKCKRYIKRQSGKAIKEK
ncbi:hypothetical protein [Methanosarcina sp. DH2]|uniref:hypothetical protein n=1 Tax=Methanosarcina sp. DH2 TaxID=2605639 RepID=UPI001E4D7A88|nr:hypothetical protein [Methanosarcina sp. DH2]